MYLSQGRHQCQSGVRCTPVQRMHLKRASTRVLRTAQGASTPLQAMQPSDCTAHSEPLGLGLLGFGQLKFKAMNDMAAGKDALHLRRSSRPDRAEMATGNAATHGSSLSLSLPPPVRPTVAPASLPSLLGAARK